MTLAWVVLGIAVTAMVVVAIWRVVAFRQEVWAHIFALEADLDTLRMQLKLREQENT